MTSISDTITSMQSDTNIMNAQKSKATTGSSTLSQDSFLQLLMAQMQNQDPTSPTDTSQWIQQEATITQVSEMQKMNSNNNVTQANSMIGKQVSFKDPSTGDSVSGLISDAISTSSGTKLVINDKVYDMATITKDNNELKFSNPTSTTSQTSTSTPGSTDAQALQALLNILGYSNTGAGSNAAGNTTPSSN